MAKNKKTRNKKKKPQKTNKRLEEIREAAYLGIPEALTALGLCYITGDGVTYNPTRAFDYFSKAAQSGNPAALYHLGVCYMLGDGCKQDPAKAKDCLSQAANLGSKDAKEALTHVEAQITHKKEQEDQFQKTLREAENGDDNAQARLGDYYIYGNGTQQNIEKGLELLEELVKKENKEAIYYLSCTYDDEELPLYDPQKAHELNQLGAQLGISECIHNIGADYINSGAFSKGLPLLKEAAQKDNPLSNFMLAYYYQGNKYLEEDKDQVFKYLKRALELKYEDAFTLYDQLTVDNYFTIEQTIELARAALSKGENDDYLMLAMLLFTQKETRAEALDILQMLTKRGDSDAETFYHLLKENLDDPEKAIIESAETGEAEDALFAGIFYYRGFIVPKNTQKAAYWFDVAAKRGNDLAKGGLGSMYLNGIGVQKDEAKGIELLKEAASQNDRHAINVLEAAYRTGTGVQRNKKMATRYARKAQQLEDNRNNFLFEGLPYGNSIG